MNNSSKYGQVTEARNAATKKQRPGEPAAKPQPGTLVDAEVDELPAPESTRVGSRRGLVYLGLCLVLIGLNLRTVFSSFSALLPEVTSQTGLPGWAVVVLTTVPVTLLGVFARLQPRSWPDGSEPNASSSAPWRC